MAAMAESGLATGQDESKTGYVIPASSSSFYSTAVDDIEAKVGDNDDNVDDHFEVKEGILYYNPPPEAPERTAMLGRRASMLKSQPSLANFGRSGSMMLRSQTTLANLGVKTQIRHYTDPEEHGDGAVTSNYLEEEMWDELIQLEDAADAKNKPNICFSILYEFFTPSRLYFVIIAAVNIAILACSVHNEGPHAAHYRSKALTMCLWNVLPTISLRNEFVHYCLHEFFVLVGKPAPTVIKEMIIEGLLHMGGIHAGCGTMSLMWLCYACYHLNTTEYAPWLLALVVDIICGLLGVAIFSALPPVRYFFHNWFEIGHRFPGWSALALLWVAVFLSYSFQLEVIMAADGLSFTPKQNYHHLNVYSMFVNPEIYIVMICTFFVIFPWLETHKVAVTAAFPSKNVAILTFKGYVPAGRFGRLSRSPLLEWHAFAISSTDGVDEHFMICGAAGDWTKDLHKNPPTHLYTRRFKFTGLPRMVELYKRVLLVCTGAGIAVPVSYLWQNRYPDSEGYYIRLLWIASNTEETYGKEWAQKLMATGRVILYDTSNRVRPDVLKLTLALTKKFNMESVFVTSNPTVTAIIIRGCLKKGVTAYGPVFDS